MTRLSSLSYLPHLVPVAHDRQDGRPILSWFARRRERETLRNLSDATLRDCGLSRADIAREIDRLR